MAGQIIQSLKQGKEGIVVGALVGGVLGFISKDFVSIDLFQQSQGLLDTLAAVEPTTKLWVVMALIGAAIGFFLDVYRKEIKGVFR